MAAPTISKMRSTPNSVIISILADDVSGDVGVLSMATLKGYCSAGPLKQLLEAKNPAGTDLYTDATCENLGLGGAVSALRIYPVVGAPAATDAQRLTTCPIKATWQNGSGLRIFINEPGIASAGMEGYLEIRFLHSAQR